VEATVDEMARVMTMVTAWEAAAEIEMQELGLEADAVGDSAALEHRRDILGAEAWEWLSILVDAYRSSAGREDVA
jgi:hypothetical protein